MVYRYRREEARHLLAEFEDVKIGAEYPLTYGMSAVARRIPRSVERVLGHWIGWHS